MPRRPREQKTTDVGLEPTASALGGLRATIAPTGQMLLDDKIRSNKVSNDKIKVGVLPSDPSRRTKVHPVLCRLSSALYTLLFFFRCIGPSLQALDHVG